jgi:hypothetical protein
LCACVDIYIWCLSNSYPLCASLKNTESVEQLRSLGRFVNRESTRFLRFLFFFSFLNVIWNFFVNQFSAPIIRMKWYYRLYKLYERIWYLLLSDNFGCENRIHGIFHSFIKDSEIYLDCRVKLSFSCATFGIFHYRIYWRTWF